jgi:hypothetical protein
MVVLSVDKRYLYVCLGEGAHGFQTAKSAPYNGDGYFFSKKLIHSVMPWF